MNNKKIGFYESHFGSFTDASSEFLNCSCENLGSKAVRSTGLPLQPAQKNSSNSFESFVSSEGISMVPSFMPVNLSKPVSKCVGSTPAAFYATEQFMGFPKYKYQHDSLPLLSSRSPVESSEFSSISSVKQSDLISISPNTLESLVTFPLQENGNSMGPNEVFLRGLPQRHLISAEGGQNPSVGCNLSNSLLRNPGLLFHNEKGLSKTSMSVPSGASALSKTRIRWNQDLHEKFVESVNRLGGAEKATPKGILKLMESEGLTIYHVKSHLQKYRIAKYMPDSSVSKSDRRASTSGVEQLEPKTGIQITEALRIQLEVQRHLHEQLEVQRNLQMRIEEQGRKLEKMFEEQLKTNGSLFEPENSDGTLLPIEDPLTLEDGQLLSSGEGSKNTHFPSKIS